MKILKERERKENRKAIRKRKKENERKQGRDEYKNKNRKIINKPKMKV